MQVKKRRSGPNRKCLGGGGGLRGKEWTRKWEGQVFGVDQKVQGVSVDRNVEGGVGANFLNCQAKI